MTITESYIKKLVSLAKEVHELQLSSSDELKGKTVPVNMQTIVISSKINYLIGYIMALDEQQTDKEKVE